MNSISGILCAVVMMSSVAAGNEIITCDVYPATAENPRFSEGSIVVLDDDSILYATTQFIDSNSDFAKARIVAKKSVDGGRSWGEQRILQENVGGLNVMSVSLLRFQSEGRSAIGMFYLIKNNFDDLKVYLRISTDEAKTFGEQILVTALDGYHVMNNDRVRQLSSGRLLCPVAWSKDVKTENHFVSFCYFSDDHGKTWQVGSSRVDLPKRGSMEPEVLELKDGRVLMIMRTQFPEIYASYSEDGGETWSEAEPWGVQAPEAPATLRRVPVTGDLMLVWNPNYQAGTGHNGKRTPLVAAISKDEGKTWGNPKVLEDRDDQTYAYTSLMFSEGRALMSYYVGDNESGWISSRFRSVPVDWFYEK